MDTQVDRGKDGREPESALFQYLIAYYLTNTANTNGDQYGRSIVVIIHALSPLFAFSFFTLPHLHIVPSSIIPFFV